MATRCTVCNHPSRLAIDMMLISEPQRAVAAQYKLTKATVTRHVGHSKAVTAAQAKAEVAHERTVLTKVLELQAIAMKAIESSLEPLEPMGAMREMGRLLDLEAKLTGALAPQAMTLKLETLSDEDLEARYLSALARGQKERDGNARDDEPS